MKKTLFSILIIILSMLIYPVFSHAENHGYIIKLKDGYTPPAELLLEKINDGCNLYFTHDENIESKIGEHIEAISENHKIKASEFNPETQLPPSFSLSSADTHYSKQWAIGAIKSETAWNLATYGNDIKIAVIDSGYSYHPDLDANVLTGENFYVTVGNEVDDFSGTDETDVTDNNGHGTHVSGIIAALIDNNMGIAGIAPKAKIVPLKCFDKNPVTGVDYETTLLMLANAICDAVDEYGCRIINMSWTSPYDTELLKAVIDYAYSKGAILVAAAGNSGNTKMYYPAGYSNVIGVGSINSNIEKSSFSNYNTSVTVTAPGEKIISTYKNTYGTVSGTSQATPMVSALAAIALSAKPDLTNDEFMSVITETATDLGKTGYDTSYGYGLVNTEAMLNKITENSDGYISPLNRKNGKTYFVIKNTSDKNSMTYIAGFADYNTSNTKVNYCNVKAVTLGKNESAEVEYDGESNNPSLFFWSLPQLKPLWYNRQ